VKCYLDEKAGKVHGTSKKYRLDLLRFFKGLEKVSYVDWEEKNRKASSFYVDILVKSASYLCILSHFLCQVDELADKVHSTQEDK
jgi:hypothetical protein